MMEAIFRMNYNLNFVQKYTKRKKLSPEMSRIKSTILTWTTATKKHRKPRKKTQSEKCVALTKEKQNAMLLPFLLENYSLYSRSHKQNAKLVLIINSISSSQRFNGIRTMKWLQYFFSKYYTDTRNDCRDEKISCWWQTLAQNKCLRLDSVDVGNLVLRSNISPSIAITVYWFCV